jgi:hypothetical protein
MRFLALGEAYVDIVEMSEGIVISDIERKNMFADHSGHAV